jgi:hypothetical protein
MYKLTGYVDLKDISTGFLIPIYTLGSNSYHHVLSDDFSTIKGFIPFDVNSYESTVKVDAGITKDVEEESIFVLKVKGEVKVCAYTKVAHLINSSYGV